MSVKKIVVDEDSSKRRLDNYLLTLLFDLPKSKVYSMVRKGEVRINSGRVKPSTKINVGDEIRLPPYINIPKKDEVRIPDNLKKTISQTIIYEDKNYIIINKPTGIAVHGGTDNKFGLITIMRDMFSEKIDLCHRIDKETSGCLVFSLNKKSTKHFNYLLQSRKVTKKYKAILKGTISKDIFINNYIGDAIMAIFGLKESRQQSLRAVSASLEMLKAMDEFKSYLKTAYGSDFDIRVGLHYGEVISGSVGQGEDKKVTVIGDAVNVASRIEAINKEAGTRFLISETVYEQVKDNVIVKNYLRLKLRGTTNLITDRQQPLCFYYQLDIINGAIVHPDGAPCL